MFATHQRTISAYARAHPDNMARVMQFVIVTVRESLFNVAAHLQELTDPETRDNAAPSVLFGWKFRAYEDVWAYRASIFAQCEDIWDHRESDDRAADDLVDYLHTLHGFGLVKAGFVSQLIYGVSGCLDSHNIREYGLPKRAFDHRKYKRLTARRKRVAKYNDLCRELGGTEVLWNNWCSFVAERQANTYADAFAVSAEHCAALKLPTE